MTSQKQAELQHAEAERRLGIATEAAKIGIWDWDIESGAFFYSPRARAIYGFGPDETITYALLQERTHPEDYTQIEPIVARALDPATRGSETYRYRITRADTGEERWLLAHGAALFSNDGPKAQALKYTGTLQDITDDVHLERALADEKARLQLALSAGDLAIWEIDVATERVIASPALNQLYGFAPDSPSTVDQFRALYAPGEWDRVAAGSAHAFSGGDPSIRFEAMHQWPDGTVKWIGVRAQVIRNVDGAPIRIIGVAMDVTDRQLVEERLRTTARELQHRVKNTLTIVQTIATQTFRTAATKEAGVAAFGGRLASLAAATELITQGNWREVVVEDLIAAMTGPFVIEGRQRFDVRGPEGITVQSQDAVSLGMALHELGTNAVKYGALSNLHGEVEIRWKETDGGLELTWRERGGPLVSPPVVPGFGSKLLRRGLFNEQRANVVLDFAPDGVVWSVLIKPVVEAPNELRSTTAAGSLP